MWVVRELKRVEAGASLLLGTLGTVLGTALGTVVDTRGVEGTAQDVITHTGKVA
ncbi:MAG: hypothetical protein ACI9F9_000633, partial [Candidatus Paceibacteria bacterium]